MVIIEKQITPGYVYPVLAKIVNGIYRSKKPRTDHQEKDGLVLSSFHLCANQRVFYFWDREEETRLTKNGKVPRSYKFIKGYLIIEKRRGWKGYMVNISFLREELRGQGLGGLLYDTVVNDEKIILMSGDRQTHASRSMWLSFIKHSRYKIWAQDINNLKRKADVFWNEDDNKLECSLKIWHMEGKVPQDKLKEDVRLVAMAL